MTNPATLPPAIQRQLDEAAALEQQVYGKPTPDDGNTEPTDPVEPEPAPADPVEAVVAPQPAPEVRKEDEDTYRQRYTVLQSKYDAEVPRLHAQLRDAVGQLQYLTSEIERLKVAPQAQPVAQEPDNDAETFGEDLVTTIDRRAVAKAKELVSKELQPLQAYIQQLEQKLGVVGEQAAVSVEDRFYTQLAKEVPDYEQINVDQGFLNWLGDVVPGTGRSRQDFLSAAANQLDVARVSEIFADYKLLTGKQVQGQQQRQTRQELERQVAPAASRGNNRPAAAPTFTRADYERAYDPRTARELGADKVAQLQAEVDQAVAEGRIQW